MTSVQTTDVNKTYIVKYLFRCFFLNTILCTRSGYYK